MFFHSRDAFILCRFFFIERFRDISRIAADGCAMKIKRKKKCAFYRNSRNVDKRILYFIGGTVDR